MLTVRPFARTAALCVSLFAFCFQPNLQAENGRNFSGFYQIQNVHPDGTQVSFDLSLKLMNYSGGDVTDATITFAGRTFPPEASASEFLGEIDHVSVKYRKFVSVHGSFTIPESEYREWQRGALPNIVVSYSNEAGDPVRNSVELSKVR